MKVVFISPGFTDALSVESSFTDIGEAVEAFMKEKFDITSDTFIRFFGDWSVYTEKEFDINLHYQGTILELLPPVW